MIQRNLHYVVSLCAQFGVSLIVLCRKCPSHWSARRVFCEYEGEHAYQKAYGSFRRAQTRREAATLRLSARAVWGSQIVGPAERSNDGS